MFSNQSFKKILWILCTIAVAFLVAYYFVYNDVKIKNEHISSVAQDLDFQSSRQEYLISTQRMIQNLQTDIGSVDNSIVASDGDVAFIESLETVAKNNGLDISIDSLNIEDNPTFISSGITTLDVKAKIKGSWIGTYTFLAEVESLPFKIKIDRFGSLSDADKTIPDGKKVPSPAWQSSFEIHVLKYK